MIYKRLFTPHRFSNDKNVGDDALTAWFGRLAMGRYPDEYPTGILRASKAIYAEAVPFLYSCRSERSFNLHLLIIVRPASALRIGRATDLALLHFRTSFTRQYIRNLDVDFMDATTNTAQTMDVFRKTAFHDPADILSRLPELKTLTIYCHYNKTTTCFIEHALRRGSRKSRLTEVTCLFFWPNLDPPQKEPDIGFKPQAGRRWNLKIDYPYPLDGFGQRSKFGSSIGSTTKMTATRVLKTKKL